MKLLNVDTLREAELKMERVWDEIGLRTEQVGLTEAEGRILAVSVSACCDVPDFRKSTVDGYAVRAKDTQGAGESIPCFLEVTGEVSIGQPAAMELKSGQCAYVPTGGMLPEGSDAVVMVEHTELFSETQVAVYAAVSCGRNVIQAGEDVRTGDAVMERGQLLTPARIGVLASVGTDEVTVYVMPEITIISTGNELVRPGEPRLPGQIWDINTYGLNAQCRRSGLRVARMDVLKDDEEVLRQAISEAIRRSDIVAVSGGSSQGKQDFTARIFDECSGGGVFTHGLALKPGKPTIIGLDGEHRTLLIGLPGHPMAAMVVFDLIVLSTLRRAMGVPEPRRIKSQMEVNVAGGSGRTVCQMVQLIPQAEQDDGSCAYTARPLLGKSGLMTVMAKADGYVMIDSELEGLKKGETVDVTPL